jgi:hypothetical protein
MSAKCHKATFAPQQIALLFDQLVGAAEHARWDIKPDCPRGRQVDEQLELGWLQHRKVRWLFAFEDAADIDATLPVTIRLIGAITHQNSGGGILTRSRHRRKRMTEREEGNLPVA